MIKKVALCAMLAVTLGLTACNSDEAVAPEPVAVEKAWDPLYIQTVLDSIDENVTSWVTVNMVVDLEDGSSWKQVPGWRGDLIFTVGIVPDEGANPTGRVTVSFSVPGIDPADPYADKIILGNAVPVRWSNLPGGNFTIELGMSYAPWSHPEDHEYTFEVYETSGGTMNLQPPSSFVVPLPFSSQGPYMHVNVDTGASTAAPEYVIIPPKNPLR